MKCEINQNKVQRQFDKPVNLCNFGAFSTGPSVCHNDARVGD